ncbi:hypothetical protein BU23DRAFT_271413 [Bimuria novae-zelandiae CBS 107.79]|uniref:Zn(2)-C6 fungal-type domain-containing protein n=1 Tax=Bimuria novae-zelandiae CBS 107.79 TaxID=1447943 RepID=A0A6A5VK79_9PLEO|nr:hypothetical protein BU23DRAFT_271413 [Bimuria novae-zelandiae CBS 107.79]
MADNAPVPWLQDFRLPHGNDDMNVDAVQESGQPLPDVEKGFSDAEDDGLDDLFEERPATQLIGVSPRGKKAIRRLSTDDDNENDAQVQPSPTKKPRITSLFGGPNEEPDYTDEALQAPQTPSTGLGPRLSSLTLNQQEGDGNEGHDGGDGDGPQRLSPALSHQSDGHIHDLLFSSDPIVSYGLRRHINRQGVASTHIDVDQSGNYDPEEAHKFARRAPAKRVAKDNLSSKKWKGKGKAKQKKLIVRLRFKAIGSVINIMEDEENWPEGHSELDSEDEAARVNLLPLQRTSTPGAESQPQIPLPDPADIKQDLTGHPEARGCKQCCRDGAECSMVSDGQYPCKGCSVNKDVECQPITEPGWTGPCDRCEAQGQPCSFENANANGNPQGAMCDECLSVDNTNCEPRRPKTYKIDRVDLNELLYVEGRDKYKACTYCRENKKRCSLLKTPDDAPPCKQCKQAKVGCHFYAATPAAALGKAKVMRKNKGKNHDTEGDEVPVKANRTFLEQIAPEFSIPGSDLFTEEDMAYVAGLDSTAEDEKTDEEPEETEELEAMEDSEGHRGVLTTIKTSFAHPMIFSVQPGAVTDCNFCGFPVFGMVGHFERDVHVIEWSNGLGYTEFGNGHRDSKKATTMCHNCTMDRIQIAVCPSHALADMEIKDSPEFEAVSEDLLCTIGGTPEVQEQLKRWCSMCFTPATHKCCTHQAHISASEDDENPLSIDGCGLRLCRGCNQRLDQLYGGDLNIMIAAFDNMPKAREPAENSDAAGEGEQGTVRADVGLLKADGLLMRCVESMAD